MIYAMNYANKKYRKSQRLNTKTAYSMGGVDWVFEFTPGDIDEEFRKKNKKILDAVKGNGYWLWKPYFMDRVLDKIEYGDWLVYADSGGFYYQNNLKGYIQKLEQQGIYAVCQDQPYIEAHYTKRDTFVIMGMDAEEYSSSTQRAAGLLILQKNEKNIQMIKEWLMYARDERVITDMPNTCGRNNYEGFISHRQDQSIFSLLSKKYEVYAEQHLWVNFMNRKDYETLFCYHHTTCGSIPGIFLYKKLYSSSFFKKCYHTMKDYTPLFNCLKK